MTIADTSNATHLGVDLSAVLFLDQCRPVAANVGYGELGLHGTLGYEGKHVTANGGPHPHAISAHGPSSVVFRLEEGFRSFLCRVALNGDVQHDRAHAHFVVRADGRQVACAPYVRAGEAPRLIAAAIDGARELELSVSSTHWEYCHSVWLDPCLYRGAPSTGEETLVDCLARAEISVPRPIPRAERCIVTVVSPGYERLLANMLGSLRTHANCEDAVLAVFVVDPDPACLQIVAAHGGIPIVCRHRARVDVTLKSIMYSVARVVDAEYYLCLDADMLILGDLRPVFATLEATPAGSILACWEANTRAFPNVASAMHHVYFGHHGDLPRILGRVGEEGSYPLVVNDGFFCGRKAALLALDGAIRSMPGAVSWVEEKRHQCWWRNQFIFNLALASLRCGVAVDDAFNLQLHTNDPHVRVENGRVKARWQGRDVRVLHFCGGGRRKFPECKDIYVSGISAREL
jgi:hypothetical protein